MLNTVLFTNDNVYVAEIEKNSKELMNKFNFFCRMKKLKVNTSRNKVMAFGKKKIVESLIANI